MRSSYHHGNLREAVLDRAVEVIAEEGPFLFSLRSLAADLGVSHTAPRHHFGSREGVLTALATQGFTLLADRLSTVAQSFGGHLDVLAAYVAFAVDHPAHFQVMFTPGLIDGTDDSLLSAREAVFAELRIEVDDLDHGDSRQEDAAASAIAGWSLAHGLAGLIIAGDLEASGLAPLVGEGDARVTARRVVALLSGPRVAGAPPARDDNPAPAEVASNKTKGHKHRHGHSKDKKGRKGKK